MSFPFIIQEVNAPKRAIILQGRSLPYQGVEWGGTQRLDMNWFPGNPVAVTQVIGPTFKPTNIRGTWKDNFLINPQNAAKIANFPQLAPAVLAGANERAGDTFLSVGSVPTQLAKRARILRDAFTLIRKGGGQLRVEWGSIVRFGFITDDNFPHAREEDIEYDIEFTWSGDTNAQPRPLLPSLDLLGLLKKMLAALDEVINALLTVVFKAQQWVTRVTQFINKLGSFVTELLSALELLAGFVFTPANVIGTIKSNLRAIVLAAVDLLRTLDSAPSAVVEAAALGDPTNVNMSNIVQARLRSSTQILAAEARKDEQLIDESQVPALLGTYTSPGGVTLRDVALKFYRDPTLWLVIAQFNGLSSSIIPRGLIVRVPRI